MTVPALDQQCFPEGQSQHMYRVCSLPCRTNAKLRCAPLRLSCGTLSRATTFPVRGPCLAVGGFGRLGGWGSGALGGEVLGG